MDREAWHAAIHGVTKSRTRLRDWSDLIWLGLSCRTWTFSGCGTWSSVVAASGLSSCGTQGPECMGSVVVALSFSMACEVLFPWPGITPASPGLQSRFLTTGTPGKTRRVLLFVSLASSSEVEWQWIFAAALSLRIDYCRHTWLSALHFTAFFNKLKICGNPALSRSISNIFPTLFSHFISLYHILVILTIFQTFSLLY